MHYRVNTSSEMTSHCEKVVFVPCWLEQKCSTLLSLSHEEIDHHCSLHRKDLRPSFSFFPLFRKLEKEKEESKQNVEEQQKKPGNGSDYEKKRRKERKEGR